MNYRAEVDGLRALAVMPVILFHAGFEYFNGGFIGVDVFFVISGYLITSIILNDLNNDNFSILRFYERRARRILPPLFLMMIVCIPFCWYLMLPKEFSEFGVSLAATSIFSSNIFFWQESGYFSGPSEFKPLLHTWSLAIEEQYYLVFPILLIIASNFLRPYYIFIFVFFIASLSFMLAIWASYNMPSANFFLLPTRAWELLVGALIAIYLLNNQAQFESTKSRSNILGLVGFFMIVIAIIIIDDKTPFPGLWTLLPVIGTGLIILFDSSNTFLGRLLSNKYIVGIGLMSYSLYLWHQPIFVFARLSSTEEITNLFYLLLICISFCIAYLSWKYLENFFRNKNNLSQSIIFLTSGIFIIFFIISGFIIKTYSSNNLIENEIARQIVSDIDNQRDNSGTFFRSDCFLNKWTDGPSGFNDICFIENSDILIWGDSHAASLYPGLSKQPFIVSQLTGICPPILGLSFGNKLNCKDINKFVFEKIKSSPPKKIILASWWASQDLVTYKNEITFTIEQIKKIAPETEIILLGQIPTWIDPHPYMNIIRILNSSLKIKDIPSKLKNKNFFENQKINKTLLMIAIKNNINFVNPHELLCTNDQFCSIFEDGTTNVLFFDTNHLTTKGSEIFVRRLFEKR